MNPEDMKPEDLNNLLATEVMGLTWDAAHHTWRYDYGDRSSFRSPLTDARDTERLITAMVGKGYEYDSSGDDECHYFTFRPIDASSLYETPPYPDWKTAACYAAAKALAAEKEPTDG